MPPPTAIRPRIAGLSAAKNATIPRIAAVWGGSGACGAYP
jgi:hypothetical protein